MNKIDTELQDKFQSSLNLDDAHVQVWTRQLDATHPLALRLERARQAIASDGAAFASAWDVWEKVDELEVERTNVKSWLTHSKQSKAEKMSELERIDAEIAALIGDKPAQTAATPAPAVAVDALVEPDKAGPLPLVTNDIANCFAGIRGWDLNRWKDELGSPDKWLKACQHRKGTRGNGGYESTWWPVQIAAALVKQDQKFVRILHARFKKQEPLRPWFDLFEINISDSCDNQ